MAGTKFIFSLLKFPRIIFVLCHLAAIGLTKPMPKEGPQISPDGQVGDHVPQEDRVQNVPHDNDNQLSSSPLEPYMYHCSQAQQNMLREAWNEAGQLAAAHYKWRIPTWWTKGLYQEAADMYLGTDSGKDPGLVYDGPLIQNVGRQYAIHYKGSSHAHAYAYGIFICDESQAIPDPTKRGCTPTSRAYTWDDLGWFYNRHYVMLCPQFFDNVAMTSLAERKEQAEKFPSLQKVMDYWLNVRARTVFHETYHWANTVSKPPCKLRPEVYDPQGVVDLATTKNTGTAKLNAQSWAFAALATWLQQTFNLPSPPTPYRTAAKDIQDSPPVQDLHLDTKAPLPGDEDDKVLDEPPTGFQDPFSKKLDDKKEPAIDWANLVQMKPDLDPPSPPPPPPPPPPPTPSGAPAPAPPAAAENPKRLV